MLYILILSNDRLIPMNCTSANIPEHTWQVRMFGSSEAPCRPLWAGVSGNRPFRFATIAFKRDSLHLKKLVSSGECELHFKDEEPSISLELVWCRMMSGSDTVILCCREIPGSTYETPAESGISFTSVINRLLALKSSAL